MHQLTEEESAARVRQLRKAGYKVRRIVTPFGVVVLRSKKRFVCHAHHCVAKAGTPPPFAAKRRKPAKRKRKAA